MSQTAAILIATKDRARSLKRTLESLSKLDVPPELTLEVIVVDNGSSDDTWSLLAEYETSSSPFRVLPIQELRSGKSAALNTALSKTSAEFILFTDDDMIFDPLWLKAILAHFNQCNCVGVHGRVEVRCLEGRPSWLTEKAQALYGDTSAVAASDGTVHELFGLNMAARSKAILEAGPFDEKLGPQGKIMGYSEDVEWSRRLGKLGKLCYVAEAVNYHCIPQTRLTRRSLWKRQFGMVRDEWRLKTLNGNFPNPWSSFFSELKTLIGALVYRKVKFQGFDYGLEIAARCARASALFEHSLAVATGRRPVPIQEVQMPKSAKGLE